MQSDEAPRSLKTENTADKSAVLDLGPKDAASSEQTAAVWWSICVVALLLSIRFMLPLLFILIIVLSTGIAILVAGVFLVRSPKAEPTEIRLRFPRLKFTKPEEWANQIELLKELERPPSDTPQTQFIQDLNPIKSFILRDFVLTWYTSISSSNAFPNEISSQLELVFSALEERAGDIQAAKLLVIRLIPILTNHFTNFAVSEDSIIGGQTLSGSTDLDKKIAKEYDTVGRLHGFVTLQAENQETMRKSYSRDRVSKLITFLLPVEEASSSVVSTLVRELLSNIVLFPVIRLLSDPDFWNQMIIKIVSSTLKDRDQVRELRDVIDKQYRAPFKAKHDKLALNDRISPQTKQPEFERYIKSIDRSTSLPLLKQLKYYIAVQISRTQKYRSQSDKLLKYRKRLDIAKTRIDSRIATLTENQPEADDRRSSVFLSKPDLDDFISSLTLSQILSNPSALSFFMEFMEQRSRTVLLQYWLTVNGIKDPLEDPLSPDYDEELSSSVDLGGSEDVKLIFKQFFDKKILKVKPEIYNEVERFVDGDDRSLESYLSVRKLILMLQMEVFNRMQERDLPDFKASDLFLKLLASESFEKSLIREVDIVGFDATDDGQEAGKNPETNPLSEIETALNKILTEEKSTSNSIQGSSTESLPIKGPSNAEKLKSDIFGNDEQGFLDEKPLFGDNEEGVNFEDEEDDCLEGDPDFFSVSHDALDLKEEIKKLEEDLEKLNKQRALLDPLILKAELTSNNSELRLLGKSKISYDREIEAKELQRQQLIVQDNENSLFGKTKVEINSWVKGHSSGKDYIIYVIEIVRSAIQEGREDTTWVVGRRFSQFYKLHDVLQHDCPVVASIPFPKKKIVLKFQQKNLIDERRSQLQNYLRRLLEIPQVCQHQEFRKFLTVEDYKGSKNESIPPSSSSRFEIKGAANKIYNGLSSGIEILSSRSQSFENIKKLDEEAGLPQQDLDEAEDMRKELENFETQEEKVESKSFVKPVTDLFIALFPLNSPNSWLRGRAIIVVLQQLLGSTIEKHIKGQIENLTTSARVSGVIKLLQDVLWPNGSFMESGTPRTPKDKIKSKQEAKVLLESLMVDTCSKIVGQTSAKTASNRLHSMLQNEILNTSLVYEILDTIIGELFPELNDN